MEQVAVIVRAERRRKWSDEDRERILAACDERDTTIQAVSERYQVAESLIYKWRAGHRRKIAALEPMRFIDCGVLPALDMPPVFPPDGPVGKLPAPSKCPPPMFPTADHDTAPTPSDNRSGLIEIVLPTGERVMVDGSVDDKAFEHVLRYPPDRRQSPHPGSGQRKKDQIVKYHARFKFKRIFDNMSPRSHWIKITLRRLSSCHSPR